MTSWAQVPAQNCAILRNKRRQACVKGKTTGRTANKSDNERPAHNRRTQDGTYNIAKNNIRTTLTRTMPMDNESYEEIEREAVLGSKKDGSFGTLSQEHAVFQKRFEIRSCKPVLESIGCAVSGRLDPVLLSNCARTHSCSLLPHIMTILSTHIFMSTKRLSKSSSI